MLTIENLRVPETKKMFHVGDLIEFKSGTIRFIAKLAHSVVTVDLTTGEYGVEKTTLKELNEFYKEDFKILNAKIVIA